jgi:DNA-binding response OmpR family regulator
MKNREDFLCALLLGAFDDSRLLIHQIFQEAGWRLLEAQGRKEALERLEQDAVHVVITRSEFSAWDWKKVLANLRRRKRPPQLIVTSRTADEQLWSEVLNCGGYDVLPEPLRRDEVERVVAAARRHYEPHQVRARGGRVGLPSIA